MSWVAPKKAIRKKSVTESGKKTEVYNEITESEKRSPQAS
jgi:hypothetical protein